MVTIKEVETPNSLRGTISCGKSTKKDYHLKKQLSPVTCQLSTDKGVFRLGRDNSIAYKKAFDFAVKIVKLYQFLSIEKKEFVLSRQLLRSGTSIAANIREALEGQSKKDFTAKMSIALKEAGETEYWLELMLASDILNLNESSAVQIEIKELIKILNSIIVSTKKNLSSQML